MSGQRKWFALFTLGIFLNTVYLGLAQASALPPGWKTECVGYYQLSLPAEVEVALPRIDIDKKGFFFTDGIEAHYSRLTFDGPLFVFATAHPPSAFEQVIKVAQKNEMEEKKQLLAEGKPNTAARIQFYADLMPETFRIDDGWGTNLYMQRSGRVYKHSIRNPYSPKTTNGALEEKKPVTVEETKQFNLLVEQSLKRFRARALFEIPPETDSGLCIPYVFIADEDKNKGKKGRKIAVTFRLKAHPDVDIIFIDDSASEDPDDPQKKAKQELRFFWHNHYSIEKLDAENGLGGEFRAVHMAGREGAATLVKITRTDDAVDYGYTAYITGKTTYNNEKDIPNLMLYVIRTAAHTRGTPMSKKELLKLAEQIAASVKRRVPE